MPQHFQQDPNQSLRHCHGIYFQQDPNQSLQHHHEIYDNKASPFLILKDREQGFDLIEAAITAALQSRL